jgi:hypothetical protein
MMMLEFLVGLERRTPTHPMRLVVAAAAAEDEAAVAVVGVVVAFVEEVLAIVHYLDHVLVVVVGQSFVGMHSLVLTLACYCCYYYLWIEALLFAGIVLQVQQHLVVAYFSAVAVDFSSFVDALVVVPVVGVSFVV